MIDTLVLHPRVRSQLENFIQQPSHALLISAPAGSGKGTLARCIAAQLLNLSSINKLASYPFHTTITPEDGSISIDQVRTALNSVRLTAPGSHAVRQTIVIEGAEKLTVEAQNALLRLLEEPPPYVVILMGASNQQGLLPTVRSRMQTITIASPPKEHLREHFHGLGYSKDVVEKALLIADGRVGLTADLLERGDEHSLVLAIIEAKRLLSADGFERLCAVEVLSKNRGDVALLLQSLERLSAAGMRGAAQKGEQLAAGRWHARQKHIYKAKQQFEKNTNLKLLITNLMLVL